MKTITKSDVEKVQKKIPFRKDLKILSISHFGCMDGTISTIPLYNVFRNTTFMKAKYGNIDEIVRGIDSEKFDMVILTDISPQDPALLDLHDNLVLIDHHDTVSACHDPDNMRFVYQDECGGTLTKKFVSMYADVDLGYLDELTRLGQDYDLWNLEDPQSRELNELHFNYWEDDFVKRFKNGDTKFTKKEKEYIESKKQEFNLVYANLNMWDIENINACFVLENKFVNEVCTKLMDEKGYDLIICKNPANSTCSFRSKHPDIHIGNILQELGFGGGHANSGGMAEEDIIKFQEKIGELVNHIEKNYYN